MPRLVFRAVSGPGPAQGTCSLDPDAQTPWACRRTRVWSPRASGAERASFDEMTRHGPHSVLHVTDDGCAPLVVSWRSRTGPGVREHDDGRLLSAVKGPRELVVRRRAGMRGKNRDVGQSLTVRAHHGYRQTTPDSSVHGPTASFHRRRGSSGVS